MNTFSVSEYTVFAIVQLLRKWREQRPSNQGDLDSSVKVESGRVCFTVEHLLLSSCLYCGASLLLGCVLN
jgi:hypothetical protein